MSVAIRSSKDRITINSIYVPDIYITVFTDKSGGFFSYFDLMPKALNEFWLDPADKDLLQQEYTQLLNGTD